MRPEHKKYILENINKKTIKEISRELNLKEKKVRRFLEKDKEKKKQIEFGKEAKKSIDKETIFFLILIMILGFLVYGNSLNGKFVWDDSYLVQNNVYLENWSYLPYLFTKNIGEGGRGIYYFYRPLQMLTYMVDRFLWKLNPIGYHLTNTLLHILVALGVYWLVNILYEDKLLSLFTSLFFVVHPVHTEAVTYISGRGDSLAALFMLISVISYIKNLSLMDIKFYAIMILSYILALLSRENSLILPVLLVLYHYTFKKKLKMALFLPLLGLACIYIVLRAGIFKFLLPHTVCPTTILQRMPGFFVAITNYARILLLPFDLHMEYGDKLFNWNNYKALLGIVIFVSPIIYALRIRNRNNLIFFSIFWFFAILLPSSNLYPLNAYMAEHWLYLPSIGFFLILAKGSCELYRAKKFRSVAVIFVTALLIFYSFLTIRQNNYWKEPLTFYNRTLKYAPDSAVLHNNIGILYGDMGNFEKAISLFQKAIKIEPRYIYAYHNLGKAYHLVGKDKEAIDLYEQLIKVSPNLSDAHYNLGNLYNETGRKEEAIEAYKKAINISPHFTNAHYNLGNVYKEIGKYQEAAESYKKAIEIEPNFAYAHFGLSIIYFYQKQYKLAVKHFDIAKDLGYTDSNFSEILKPYRESNN